MILIWTPIKYAPGHLCREKRPWAGRALREVILRYGNALTMPAVIDGAEVRLAENDFGGSANIDCHPYL